MSPLPNIQTAQYGDRVAIEKLGGVRRTNNPAADVNGLKQMAGGRPRETDPVALAVRMMQQPQQQAQAQPQFSDIELEHQNELENLADLYADTMRAIKVAQRPGAGRLTQNFARNMIRYYASEFMRVRGITPNFDIPEGI